MEKRIKKQMVNRSKKGKKRLLLWAALAALFMMGCGNSGASTEQTEQTEQTEHMEDTAVQNTTEAAETTSDLTAAKVGSLITFGHYEQDNDTSNGKEPIEWIVLEKREDGSLVVMSRYALDVHPYHSDRKSVSWRTCTLRKWLNTTFLNSAFSSSELAVISTENSSNADNASYRAEDRVFLFTILEARGYFAGGSDGDPVSGTCKPTDYVKAKGIWTVEGGEFGGNCRWWLRSPGDDATNAAYVGFNGQVYNLGRTVNRDDTAIRPALVLKP